MTMDKVLYDKIISANIDVHKKEARVYETIHAFGMNWYAQRVLNDDLREIFKAAPGKRACDLGCGTGNVTTKLLYAGYDITAVDLSGEMITQLNKKISGKKNLNTFCMNIDRFLREKQDKYDIIIIYAVLHHMPDYLNTISMALDHLSDRGMLYLVDGIHRQKLNEFYEFIRRCFLKADRQLYVLLHGEKELIYNHGIDYSFFDYHCNAAGTSGLDVDKIKGLIEEKGFYKLINFSPCNIGMYVGFLAMLDDRVPFPKNCFRLIARKG